MIKCSAQLEPAQGSEEPAFSFPISLNSLTTNSRKKRKRKNTISHTKLGFISGAHNKMHLRRQADSPAAWSLFPYTTITACGINLEHQPDCQPPPAQQEPLPSPQHWHPVGTQPTTGSGLHPYLFCLVSVGSPTTQDPTPVNSRSADTHLMPYRHTFS